MNVECWAMLETGPNMVLHDRLARMHLVHVCSLITNAPEAQMVRL